MSGSSRVGIAVATVVLLVAAGPSGEPDRPVADVRHVVAMATLRVADGGAVAFAFDIEAQKSMAGSGTLDNADGTLDVTVRRCDPECHEVGAFAKDLAVGEFDVAEDLATASLETVLFGAPVAIAWEVQGGGMGSVEVTVYPVSSAHGARVVHTRRLLSAEAAWQWRDAARCVDRVAEVHERSRVDFPFPRDVPDAAEPLDELLGFGPVACG